MPNVLMSVMENPAISNQSVNNPNTMKRIAPFGLIVVVLGTVITIVTSTLWPILAGLCIGVFCMYWDSL